MDNPTVPPHDDGTPCTCVWSTVQWWRYHCHPRHIPPHVLAPLREALDVAVDAFANDSAEEEQNA
jgi:hypothetical protein